MAVQYDPSVIRQFAAKLYSRATSTVIAWCFMGFIGGGLAGGLIGSGLGELTRSSGGVAAIFTLGGAAFGVAMGYVIGTGKAFRFKLEAQVALCQVQIEENTRRAQQPLAASDPQKAA